MGKSLRLLTCFVLGFLVLSHEVQADCFDNCLELCRVILNPGLICLPKCFGLNCLRFPSGNGKMATDGSEKKELPAKTEAELIELEKELRRTPSGQKPSPAIIAKLRQLEQELTQKPKN